MCLILLCSKTQLCITMSKITVNNRLLYQTLIWLNSSVFNVNKRCKTSWTLTSAGTPQLLQLLTECKWERIALSFASQVVLPTQTEHQSISPVAVVQEVFKSCIEVRFAVVQGKCKGKCIPNIMGGFSMNISLQCQKYSFGSVVTPVSVTLCYWIILFRDA